MSTRNVEQPTGPPVHRRNIHRLQEYILEAVLIALCVGLAIHLKTFRNPVNLLHILQNSSIQGVIAFGMTVVIIAGEIDLSVGSMVGFAGCLIAWFTGYLSHDHWPVGLAILVGFIAALISAAIAGGISGILRVRFAVPTFIATLAWMTALRGAAGRITNGFPLTPFPDWYLFFFSGKILGIPFPAIVFIVVFALIHFIMNYTTFGRSVYAVGGNAEAARLSGINVSSVKVGVMILVAALAVLASLMESSKIFSGSDTDAVGWELDVIASVIIGGTSLQGGSGKVWGTFIGIIFLGVLTNGMTLLNYEEYTKMIVRGVLILTAVLLNSTTSPQR
jgi:ribose/xylose/arabinose/galactoside ABC-type transport system permease subunit